MEKEAIYVLNLWNPPPLKILESVYDIKKNVRSDGSIDWYFSMRFSDYGHESENGGVKGVFKLNTKLDRSSVTCARTEDMKLTAGTRFVR